MDDGESDTWSSGFKLSYSANQHHALFGASRLTSSFILCYLLLPVLLELECTFLGKESLRTELPSGKAARRWEDWNRWTLGPDATTLTALPSRFGSHLIDFFAFPIIHVHANDAASCWSGFEQKCIYNTACRRNFYLGSYKLLPGNTTITEEDFHMCTVGQKGIYGLTSILFQLKHNLTNNLSDVSALLKKSSDGQTDILRRFFSCFQNIAGDSQLNEDGTRSQNTVSLLFESTHSTKICMNFW